MKLSTLSICHPMTAFDDWAEYYDILHQGLEGEAEFYVGQAVRTCGAVLELGCGTGRLAIPMAMCGLTVTGVDNSPAMLDRCRYKLQRVRPVKGRLRLIQQDIAELSLDQQFDFIAMAYRTFMHLLTPEEQRACLQAVRRHLKPGGMFIMNTWLPNLERLILNAPGGPQSFLEVGRHEIDGGTLVHHVRTQIDEFRQLLIEEHRIEEFDIEGRLAHECTLPMVRAWTTYRELRLLVTEHFQVQAIFGDFDATPLTPASIDMIWVLS